VKRDGGPTAAPVPAVRVEQPLPTGTSPFRRVPTGTHPAPPADAPRAITFEEPTRDLTSDGHTVAVAVRDILGGSNFATAEASDAPSELTSGPVAHTPAAARAPAPSSLASAGVRGGAPSSAAPAASARMAPHAPAREAGAAPPALMSMEASAIDVSLESSEMGAPPASAFDGFPEEATSPGMIPAAFAAAEAIEAKRGEITQLVQAIGPFLWSLEEAAKWVKDLAETGDGTAQQHARSLALLARILAQLQARVDELHKL
jgi:hypothetical protein